MAKEQVNINLGPTKKERMAKQQWKRNRPKTKTSRRPKVSEKKVVDLRVAPIPTPPGNLWHLPVDDVFSDMQTSDYLFHVSAVAPGTGAYQRIGRKINWDAIRIQLQMELTSNADGFQISRQLRVCLVLDKQPTGAKPTKGTIFGGVNGAGTHFNSQFNSVTPIHQSRFRILYDSGFQTLTCRRALNGTNSVNVRFLDKYIPLKTIQTTYSGPTADIASVNTNALYLAFLTAEDASSAANGQIKCYGNVRLTYKDQ